MATIKIDPLRLSTVLKRLQPIAGKDKDPTTPAGRVRLITNADDKTVSLSVINASLTVSATEVFLQDGIDTSVDLVTDLACLLRFVSGRAKPIEIEIGEHATHVLRCERNRMTIDGWTSSDTLIVHRDPDSSNGEDLTPLADQLDSVSWAAGGRDTDVVSTNGLHIRATDGLTFACGEWTGPQMETTRDDAQLVSQFIRDRSGRTYSEGLRTVFEEDDWVLCVTKRQRNETMWPTDPDGFPTVRVDTRAFSKSLQRLVTVADDGDVFLTSNDDDGIVMTAGRGDIGQARIALSGDIVGEGKVFVSAPRLIGALKNITGADLCIHFGKQLVLTSDGTTVWIPASNRGPVYFTESV